MAYIIKLANNDTYYSGKEDAVWTDDQTLAQSYANKKAVDAAIKELTENWTYSLTAVSV